MKTNDNIEEMTNTTVDLVVEINDRLKLNELWFGIKMPKYVKYNAIALMIVPKFLETLGLDATLHFALTIILQFIAVTIINKRNISVELAIAGLNLITTEKLEKDQAVETVIHNYKNGEYDNIILMQTIKDSFVSVLIANILYLAIKHMMAI